MRAKKAVPSGRLGGQMLLPWTSPVKNGTTAIKVSGIIESSPSTVAAAVPNLMPRFGISRRSTDRTAPTTMVKWVTGRLASKSATVSAHQPVSSNPNSTGRYEPVRIMFTAMTGIQPSQYIHTVTPLM